MAATFYEALAVLLRQAAASPLGLALESDSASALRQKLWATRSTLDRRGEVLNVGIWIAPVGSANEVWLIPEERGEARQRGDSVIPNSLLEFRNGSP